MAADYDHATRSGRQIASERQDSLLAAVAHYKRGPGPRLHGLRESALKLFSDLRRIHRLPRIQRMDRCCRHVVRVGDYVNRTGRHRHCYYIISHSEILGYTLQQRRVIAAIARYLGKSRPAIGDGPIKVLPPSEQKHIAKASLLLRLAWALNLGRSGALKTSRVRIHEASVEFDSGSQASYERGLELWAVERERALLPRSFRM